MNNQGLFWVDVVREIGRGGLGVVEEVHVSRSTCEYPVGLRLARKKLGPQWAADPGATERFEREISMLSTMSHPTIVPFRGRNVAGERTYFMPLYANSLRQTILAMNSVGLPLRSVISIGLNLASALEYAHARNYVHRDLKPENILVASNGDYVIADWGLGQFIHKESKVFDLTRGVGLGTALYCPLEQWANGQCGAPGDIYSLGLVLAELALGRGGLIAQTGVGLPRGVFGFAQMPVVEFDRIIAKMTAMFAKDRYQTVTALRADLLTLQALV